MARYIKMFEGFSNDDYENQIADQIFENFKDKNLFRFTYLFEADFWDDEEDLTSGERAAFSRDFQILTKEQLAVLYLRALGAEEGDPGRYLVSIRELRDFGYVDGSTGQFVLTNPALADAIGVNSTRTVTRTISKFRNLISGVGETQSEAIYPKLMKSFEYFSQENPSNLALIASSIITDAQTNTRNRDEAEADRDIAANRRAEKNKEILRVGEMVFMLQKDLRQNPVFRDPAKAERTAITKIANELNMDPAKVKDAYDKFKISKGI